MLGTSWVATTSAVQAADVPTVLRWALAALARALGRGATSGRATQPLSGVYEVLSLLFISPPPVAHSAHNGLPTVRYIDVLHSDRLLAAIAVFSQGFNLCGEGPSQLVVASLVRLKLR